jgi:hypothetical protein
VQGPNPNIGLWFCLVCFECELFISTWNFLFLHLLLQFVLTLIIFVYWVFEGSFERRHFRKSKTCNKLEKTNWEGVTQPTPFVMFSFYIFLRFYQWVF